MSDTLWMLMARFRGQPMIPAEDVCREYFGDMDYRLFLKKLGDGDISLPIIRMTETQKTPRYVHLTDLAKYIDARHDEARRETV